MQKFPNSLKIVEEKEFHYEFNCNLIIKMIKIKIVTTNFLHHDRIPPCAIRQLPILNFISHFINVMIIQIEISAVSLITTATI